MSQVTMETSINATVTTVTLPSINISAQVVVHALTVCRMLT